MFRMNVTLCLHRAATEEEIAGLPESWHNDLSGMAGGPVEVLWTKGCGSSPSAMPCHNPHQIIVDPKRPDLWAPGDCEECEPCLARKTLRGSI